MMHQRDQRIARTKLLSGVGHDAERKPIDNDCTAHRYSREQRQCGPAPFAARPRKPFTEIDNIDLPAELFEFRDYATIIGIAAGRVRKVARHREGETPHHKSASYQARATCDSDSVTRIALSSRPSRPSFPVRAASASRSNICLVRNSVGV